MLHCLSALYSLYSVGIDHLGCGGACARAFHLSWLYIWDGWAKFITGIIRHNSTDAKTAAITYSSGELVLLWLPFSFVFHLVIVQPIDRYLMIVSKAWIFDCNPSNFSATWPVRYWSCQRESSIGFLLHSAHSFIEANSEPDSQLLEKKQP